jgi:hypothetical protein
MHYGAPITKLGDIRNSAKMQNKVKIEPYATLNLTEQVAVALSYIYFKINLF